MTQMETAGMRKNRAQFQMASETIRLETLKAKHDAEKFLSIWSALPRDNQRVRDKENIVRNCDYVLKALGRDE